MAKFGNVLLVAWLARSTVGGCARGDQLGEGPGLGDAAILTVDDSSSGSPGNFATSGVGLGGSGSDMGASGAGVNAGTGVAAGGGGMSGSVTSGAATAGTTTSGTGVSGSAAAGAATAGSTGSGSATTSGSASAGTATSGTGVSAGATSGAATSGTAASGMATSGGAGSGTASSGNAALTVVARLAVDGPNYVGVDYPGQWQASPVGTACGPYGYETSRTVHGTNDAPLFRGEVHGNPVKCTIGTALASGTYRVRLYFAEIYWGPGCASPGGVGTRVFDIVLEATTVLRNLDVFAESGGCLASTTSTSGVPVVKTFDISVTDGTLDISLPATHDNAKISALEVLGPL
jgi:hypothetical protein